MLIHWLRRLLALDLVYVVHDGTAIVGVATTRQGAEVLRHADATESAFEDLRLAHGATDYQQRVEARRREFYDQMWITCQRVQDI